MTISEQDKSLHGVIIEAMRGAGLKPVKFPEPLKSVGALVVFRKKLEVRTILDAHKAVGWALNALLGHFNKHLYDIREFTVKNRGGEVIIEATVNMSDLTCEDDHEAWFDEHVELYRKAPFPAIGYFYYDAPYYSWDSAERLSPIRGFIQMDGSESSVHVGQKEIDGD